MTDLNQFEIIKSTSNVITELKKCLSMVPCIEGSVLDACGSDGRLGFEVCGYNNCNDLTVVDINLVFDASEDMKNTKYIESDILEHREQYDIVVSNPPFGSKGSAAMSKFKKIWSHIVSLGREYCFILVPESKKNIGLTIIRDSGKVPYQGKMFRMPIIDRSYDDRGVIPTVEVRWILGTKNEIHRRCDKINVRTFDGIDSNVRIVSAEPKTLRFKTSLNDLLDKEYTDYKEIYLGQVKHYSLSKSYLPRTPKPLTQPIMKATVHQIDQFENPEQYLTCGAESCGNGTLGNCMSRDKKELSYFLNQSEKVVKYDMDSFFDCLLNMEVETLALTEIERHTSEMISREKKVYSGELVDLPKSSHRLNHKEMSLLMESRSLAIRANNENVNITSNGAYQSIGLPPPIWSKDSISNMINMTKIKRILPITPRLTLIRWGNLIIATTNQWSAIIHGYPYVLLGPSTLLDYRILVAEYRVGISVWSKFKNDSLVKAYCKCILSSGSNEMRVKRAKFLIGSIKYIAAVNKNQEVSEANDPYLKGLIEDYRPDPNIENELKQAGMGIKVEESKNQIVKFIQDCGNLISRKGSEGARSIMEITSIEKYMAIAFVDVSKTWRKYVKRTTQVPNLDKRFNDKITCLFKRLCLAECVKRRRSPILEGPDFKVNRIKAILSSSYDSHISKQSLNILLPDQLLSGVRVKDCIDGYSGLNVEEFLNDKSCTKSVRDITINRTTERELQAYLTRTRVRPSDCLDAVERSIFKGQAKEDFITTTNELKRFRHPVKLQEKEKEMKEDSRAYGINTLEGKLGIAQFTSACQVAAKIVPMNFMISSEAEKSEQLHAFSQKLKDKSTYFCGVDIVGHNQTFSPETMKDLVEAIVDAVSGFNSYGWENVFRHLSTFLQLPEHEGLLVLHNQVTGIEGWFVYLWGIHTALVMSLFAGENAGISCPGGSSYADDIGMLVRIEGSEFKLTSAIDRIEDHWSRVGQEVKPSQTIVSKDLFVLLKTHYLDGQPIDTSLKQLCRFNVFGEELINTEQASCASIQAGEASFYEKSVEDAVPGMFLSRVWHLVLGVRALSSMACSKMWRMADHSKIDSTEVKSRVIDSIRHQHLVGGRELIRDTSMSNEIFQRILDGTVETDSIELLGLTSKIEPLFNTTLQNLTRDYSFMEDLEEFLWTPRICGGLGLEPVINLTITGHSCPILRKLSFLDRYSYKFHRRILARVTRCMTSQTRREESLVLEEFPLNAGVQTDSSAIVQFIKKELQNNKWVKSSIINGCMLKIAEEEKMLSALVKANRKKFCFRIVNAYYSLSQSKFLKSFIEKVSSSRTVASISKNFWRLQLKLSFISETRLANYLLPVDDNIQIYSSNQKFLEEIRRTAFHDVNFCDTTEPDVLDSLVDGNYGLSVVCVGLKAKSIVLNEFGETIRKPQRTTTTTEKFRSLQDMTRDPQKDRLERASRITKWILKASFYSDPEAYEPMNNIIRNCEIIYEDWNHKMKKEYILDSEDPDGGQVLHRIRYDKGKQAVGNHLPLLISGSVGANFLGGFFRNGGGENNTVNYSLWKLSLGFLTHSRGVKRTHWSFKPANNCRDARINFTTKFNSMNSIDHNEISGNMNKKELMKEISMVLSSEDGILRFKEGELERIGDKLVTKGLINTEEMSEIKLQLERHKLRKIDRVDSIEIAELSELGRIELTRNTLAGMKSDLRREVCNLLCRSCSKDLREGRAADFQWKFATEFSKLRPESLTEVAMKCKSVVSNDWMESATISMLKDLYLVSRAIIEDERDAGGKGWRMFLTDNFDYLLEDEKIMFEKSVIEEAISEIPREYEIELSDLKEPVFESGEFTDNLMAIMSEVRQMGEVREAIVDDSWKTTTVRDENPYDIISIVSAARKIKTSGIVNLTGGRCFLAHHYNRLAEKHSWPERMESMVRKDEYTRYFNQLESVKGRQNIEEKEEFEEVNYTAGDLLIVELSFISNAMKVGEKVRELCSSNPIILRPGKKWKQFCIGFKSKASLVQIIRLEINGMSRYLIGLNLPVKTTGRFSLNHCKLKASLEINEIADNKPAFQRLTLMDRPEKAVIWTIIIASHRSIDGGRRAGSQTLTEQWVNSLKLRKIKDSLFFKQRAYLWESKLCSISGRLRSVSWTAWCGLIALSQSDLLPELRKMQSSIVKEGGNYYGCETEDRAFNIVVGLLESLGTFLFRNSGLESINPASMLWSCFRLPNNRKGEMKLGENKKEIEDYNKSLEESMLATYNDLFFGENRALTQKLGSQSLEGGHIGGIHTDGKEKEEEFDAVEQQAFVDKVLEIVEGEEEYFDDEY